MPEFEAALNGVAAGLSAQIAQLRAAAGPGLLLLPSVSVLLTDTAGDCFRFGTLATTTGGVSPAGGTRA